RERARVRVSVRDYADVRRWTGGEALGRRFRRGAEAAGADVYPACYALDDQGGLARVGVPQSIGPAFRVADVVPELRALAAHITFSRHEGLLVRTVVSVPQCSTTHIPSPLMGEIGRAHV